MPITSEFTAEIDAATTVAGDAAEQNRKDEAEKDDPAFIERKEGATDGDNTGVGDETGPGDPGAGEAGPNNQGGEGTPEGEGAPEGGNAGRDGGNAGDGTDEKVSAAMLARAISSGLQIGDALALGNDKNVEAVVSRLESQDRNVQQADADAEAADQAVLDAEQRKKDLLERLPDLDPEETDPAVLKSHEALKSLLLEQQEQLEAVRANQSSQNQAADAAREKELTSWFEGQATDLNTKFGKVLGANGDAAVVLTADKSDQIAGRMAIMIAGYADQGVTTPPLESMFDDAARIVCRDEFARMDEAALAERLDKRNSQGISRPGGSKGTKAAGSPEDEVAAIIDSQYFADRS